MDIPPGVPLDQLPGLKPPAGVVPNFINPDNYQSTIIATLAVCLTVATLVTALRLCSKFFIIKNVALEDCKYSSSEFIKNERSNHFTDAAVIAWVCFVSPLNKSKTPSSCHVSAVTDDYELKALYVAYIAVSARTLQYGNGVHQWNFPLSSVIEFVKASTSITVVSHSSWANYRPNSLRILSRSYTVPLY